MSVSPAKQFKESTLYVRGSQPFLDQEPLIELLVAGTTTYVCIIKINCDNQTETSPHHLHL